MSGRLRDSYQSKYSSILGHGVLNCFTTPSVLRKKPKNLDILERYVTQVPRTWPIPKNVSCSSPLYIYYQLIKKIGQTETAEDIRKILCIIRSMHKKYIIKFPQYSDPVYYDDYYRIQLKNLSSFSYPKVFSDDGGPAYMLFCHLHSLTGKAPFTVEQIKTDISGWVGKFKKNNIPKEINM